jgi:hypothetical protein
MSITNRTAWSQFLAAISIAMAVVLVFRFREFVLPPPPGYSVALLGLLAVVMTFVLPRDPSKIEKAAWIGCAFCLMCLEMWAISHDRTTQDGNFRAMLSDVEDSIKTQTGGDSFAFIGFTPEEANVRFNQFPASSSPYFLVSITSQGKYPLRDIHVTLMDDERRLQAMQEYNKNPVGNWIEVINAADTLYVIPYLRPQSPQAPSGDVELLGNYAYGSKDANDLDIAFSSLNGSWNERLHLRRINGQWRQALSVMGPTAQQVQKPFIFYDSDFPEGKALAEKDWQFPKPQAPPAVQ